jgi:hypothetical protein
MALGVPPAKLLKSMLRLFFIHAGGTPALPEETLDTPPSSWAFSAGFAIGSLIELSGKIVSTVEIASIPVPQSDSHF